jgi:hypothetical protein
MTDLDIANMLAAYHKECDDTEGNGHKGLVQLKHARIIREAIVKNCSIPDVVERSEQFCECEGDRTYCWYGADNCQWCDKPFKD